MINAKVTGQVQLIQNNNLYMCVLPSVMPGQYLGGLWAQVRFGAGFF